MISLGNGNAPVSGDATTQDVRGVEQAGVGAQPAPELTAVDIAALVERTRMERLLDLDARIASLKLERECLASQVRNEMQRDGVLRHKIPGVGTFILYPPKHVKPCDSCQSQFGFGEGDCDSYLTVKRDGQA